MHSFFLFSLHLLPLFPSLRESPYNFYWNSHGGGGGGGSARRDVLPAGKKTEIQLLLSFSSSLLAKFSHTPSLPATSFFHILLFMCVSRFLFHSNFHYFGILSNTSYPCL